MRVEVIAQAPLRRLEVRRLRRSVTRMARQLIPRPGADVSVALVGEDEIRRLNAEYRGIDEPTDVLSFPMMTAEELGVGATVRGEPLGDIVICVPIADRQAAQRGETRLEELELLAAHGLLHLLGHDDSDEDAAALMATMENRLLGRSIVR